jgi:hypothetical protein
MFKKCETFPLRQLPFSTLAHWKWGVKMIYGEQKVEAAVGET